MAEAKRVVFDLSDTLADGLKWRPGAKELLVKLKAEKVVPIVWTNVAKRTASDITGSLDGFHNLVREVVTKELSAGLLSGLAKNMAASGNPEKVELAKKIKPDNLAKIPAAVGSRILVDDDYTLRAEAQEFGAIVIDPTPTDEDVSPDQWADRVAVAIFANLQD